MIEVFNKGGIISVETSNKKKITLDTNTKEVKIIMVL